MWILSLCMWQVRLDHVGQVEPWLNLPHRVWLNLPLYYIHEKIYINTQIIYINCVKALLNIKVRTGTTNCHLMSILSLWCIWKKRALTKFTLFYFYGWKSHFPLWPTSFCFNPESKMAGWGVMIQVINKWHQFIVWLVHNWPRGGGSTYPYAQLTPPSPTVCLKPESVDPKT